MPSDRRFVLRNQTRDRVLASDLRIADRFLTRLRGLLFQAPLQGGQGLFIKPCRQIHMFWMSYPIDVLFVDEQNQVVGAVERIAPNRVSPYFASASGAFELPAGLIGESGTAVGDALHLSCSVETEK